MVHFLEMRDLMRDQVIYHRHRRHHDAPREGQGAVRRAGAPAAGRVAEANGLGAPADGLAMAFDERLDLAPCLALEEVGQASLQVTAVAVYEKHRRALDRSDRNRASPGRLVDDEMRHAAQRYLDARSDLRPLRHLGQTLLQPALLAAEKKVDFTLPEAWWDGDPEALAAGVYAQREAPRAIVFDNLKGQR